MTWRQTAWAGKQKWLFVGMSVLFLGILILTWVDDSSSDADRIVGGLLIIVTWLFLMVMHNWLRIEAGRIRMGFFPLYWVTLPLPDVRDISVVTIHPFREFGGTGLKGSARSQRGILLGGVPNTGLRFETFDDRRYTVTFSDLQPIIAELEARGFTLSAESARDS